MKLALLLAALVAAPALAAQSGEPASAPPIEDSIPGPYRDPAAAAPVLLRLIAAHPERFDLHLAAARELTALGLLCATRPEREARLRDAVTVARAAVALDSASAEGHYWLAAALGLAADQAGGLGKITFAREAYTETMATLAIDLDHAGAHHIRGRLHAGALRLGRLNRLIARGLGLGAILSTASWGNAERDQRRALELDPEPLVHSVELAKLLRSRKQRVESTAILTDVAGRPPRHALDAYHIEEARRLLDIGTR